MKKQILIFVFGLISFIGYGQALTGDQVAVIKQNTDYLNRVKSTLLLKAEYWKEAATPNRSDVNRRMQKRKQLARTILTTSWIDTNYQQVGAYWLAYYQTSNPVLDGNGIPTYVTIFNNFDATYDSFAGYLIGDENETEIYW